MVLILVLSGAAGVLLVGCDAMRTSVDAALMCPGGVFWNCQGELILHGGEEGTYLA